MSDKKKFLPSFQVYRPADLSKNWFVWYYENGRRIRKYGNINTFDTRAGREEAAQRMIDELKETIGRPIKEQLYKYLEDRRGNWKRKTYLTYKSKLDTLFNFLGGRALTKDRLQDFFNLLAREHHKTTYNCYRQQLHSFLDGVGALHLFPDLEKVRSHQTPAKYFQSHQVKRLRRAMADNDPELWFACQLMYYCFLRPGSELRLLKVGDIDTDNWLIRIEGDISKNTKTEYVNIPNAFKKDVYTFIGDRGAGEWLFPSPHDKDRPIGGSTLAKRHRKVLTRCGFGVKYKFYSWKHTGAVACVKAGVNIKDLQIQLRHSSLEMVDKYLRQLGINNLEDLTAKFPGI